MSVHVFPILNPPPTSLSITSLWVLPVHQPGAPCIMHQTWTGDSFHIWYFTYFNAILPIIPPSPSPTESKRLFNTSVSLLLSCIQGYHYLLSKFHIYAFSSVQLLSSVWLFAIPSMPGLLVHHQLPEFTQTHVHWLGDAIQPSHPLSSPSSAPSPSQHQSLFQWVNSSHEEAKVLEFQL